mgnify:CR=1 FL=1
MTYYTNVQGGATGIEAMLKRATKQAMIYNRRRTMRSGNGEGYQHLYLPLYFFSKRYLLKKYDIQKDSTEEIDLKR